ncbi:MAG: S9 family peptidase [Candidatus Obscuribacterales bacterium]|nr:S9 family peptidase [Candidatus Obscuribacterales bacterium]
MSGNTQQTNSGPPRAKKLAVTTLLHGDTLIDEYAWMRNRDDADLMPHLRAEDAYADAYMSDTNDLQAALFAEMRGRMKEADTSVPNRRGRFLYYSRTETGKQYPVSCRKPLLSIGKRGGKSGGHKEGPEQILLDHNQLAEGKAFFQVGPSSLSPSQNFLAYAYDDTGFRQYKLVVKNLRTGQTSPVLAERVTSVAWASDNKTLFYTTEDAVTKRSNQVYRHKLGTKSHVLIKEEKNEFFRVGVARSRSGRYIYLETESHTTGNVARLPADKPLGRFKTLMPRLAGIKYDVDDDGKHFYIRTNEGATDFRLFKTAVGKPARQHWQEVVPHQPGVLLTGFLLFKGHLVAFRKDTGVVRVQIIDLNDFNVSHDVQFPEPVYTVGSAGNLEYDSTTLRLSYQSLVTPPSVLDYDMSTRSMSTVKVQEVPGYKASDYESKRLFASAPDGTLVPISLVYKKGIKLNNSNPLHLYGYGSYGFGLPTTFGAARVSLLDRGYVYALAHIRGGDELGESWRADGKLKKKMNTFTDFIACAEYLIAEGYTSSQFITMEGGSAGGLLMGAVLNLRPDLFKAAIVKVPFVDVINTMLDETLPLTVGEFEEWGNPKVKEDYDYIRRYSPYENINTGAYPAILVKSAFYDSQVMYWEPAKYVARLRDRKTDDNPLLFKILLEAGGHGGKSGRFDALKETAFDYAFLLKQVGLV